MTQHILKTDNSNNKKIIN